MLCFFTVHVVHRESSILMSDSGSFKSGTCSRVRDLIVTFKLIFALTAYDLL